MSAAVVVHSQDHGVALQQVCNPAAAAFQGHCAADPDALRCTLHAACGCAAIGCLATAHHLLLLSGAAGPPHPAAVWACVVRFEVWGCLIPAAHQQQARQECCSSLDFDKATDGCWALRLPALIAAMI